MPNEKSDFQPENVHLGWKSLCDYINFLDTKVGEITKLFEKGAL